MSRKMRYELRHIMMLWLCCLTAVTALAQSQVGQGQRLPQAMVRRLLPQAMVPAMAVASDTLELRFDIDSTVVDMAFDGNAARWQSFMERFRTDYANKSPQALSLDIYAGASPEGYIAHNSQLAEARGQAIRQLIQQQLGNRIGNITVHNEGSRWADLYRMVAASNEPWRDEVLDIIVHEAQVNETGRDRREYLLRHRRDGVIWEKLASDYLPKLRSGASAILSWDMARDTIVIKDTVVIVNQVPVVVPNMVVANGEGNLYRASDSTRVYKPVVRKPVWMVKMNLPLLATATPNLQLEWSLDHRDRWSFNIEGVWSWWTFAYNGYANEIIYGSMEIRHWLGRRWRHHTLEGWHIGLGIGGGYGDIEWKSKGYQAEVYSGFINIGWQGRFGKNRQWALDMGIGLGYAHIPWRRYKGSSIYPEGHEEVHDDHLLWRETGRTNWIGSPHANISIGYVFPQKDAEWRRNKAVRRYELRNEDKQFRDSLLALEKFERDSLKIAEKQRIREASLLPKDERRAEYEAINAEKKAAKAMAKEDKKLAKEARKDLKRQAKVDKRLERELTKQEKTERKAELQEQRQLNSTPEAKETRAALKRQAKADKKAAKRQEKLERKAAKIREKIEAEQERNRLRLQREMEQRKHR